jgi:ParB family transcriptional regulator, chromosome partitioning protein
MPGKHPKIPRAAGHASTGLAAIELQAAPPPNNVAELHRAVEGDGGKVLAIYREPYGGRWLVLAALPIELVDRPLFNAISPTRMFKN